jgi:hypothetical protein
MPHLVTIHGYGGTPDSGWKGWLRTELIARGWTVDLLAMPDTDAPKREAWIATALAALQGRSQETHLLGHSLGSITALLALSRLAPEQQLGSVTLLAGFGRPLHDPNYAQLDHFTEQPMDVVSVKRHVQHVIVAHAKTDPVVPYAEGLWLHEQLGGTLLTLPDAYQHCSSSMGCVQIPEVLQALMRAARETSVEPPTTATPR